MEWSANAIVLSVKRHGETSAIVDVLTRDHGRSSGLVRGGRSRRMRPILQQGNFVHATWRARLEDHLGNFTIEADRLAAASYMTDRFRLAGLNCLTSMCMLLPEREPHPRIYQATRLVLEALEDSEIWPALLVRWETGLLEELGFGLDLNKCAATGSTEQLVYVSPKTGRAVSAGAGKPYKDKLFVLPPFLAGRGNSIPTRSQIILGYQLTGYFLMRHIYEPRGLEMPDSRQWIIDNLKQQEN